jgi:hypothetical protein
MMAVPVRTTPDFVAGRPRQLFTGRYGREPYSSHPTYDVSRDGKKFLLVKDDGWEVPRKVHLVFNWLAQLERSGQ